MDIVALEHLDTYRARAMWLERCGWWMEFQFPFQGLWRSGATFASGTYLDVG